MCNQPVGGLLPLVLVGSTAKGTLQQHDPCLQLLIMDVDLLGHGLYLSKGMEVARNRKREQYRQPVADKSHGAVILATSAAVQVAPSALSKIANAAGVIRGSSSKRHRNPRRTATISLGDHCFLISPTCQFTSVWLSRLGTLAASAADGAVR